MFEFELKDGVIRACDFCRFITNMKIKVELQCTEEFFCSKECRDKYFKQHELGMKV